MRLIPSDQSRSDLTLNEVFGTRGQVRLLRILTTETDGSLASPEVAKRAGMTPSGARKALRRLARAGVVEKVGRGKATRYVLDRERRLGHQIARLFELERMASDPSWSPDPPSETLEHDQSGGTSVGSEVRHTQGNGNGNGGASEHSAGPGNGNGNGRAAGHSEGPANGKASANGNGDRSSPARAVDMVVLADADRRPGRELVDLDPTSCEFHCALVSLLEEDLSLIRRARERVAEKLRHRERGNGHDLWEWRKILDTYPLPRLLNFLESESPRAVRLRETSPFVDALSAEDRERLGDLVERVH